MSLQTQPTTPIEYKAPSAKVLLLAPRPDDCDWSEHIAEVAAVCRQSTPKRGEDARAFCRKLLGWGHETPFEFVQVQLRLVTSRAVAMELLRHRLCSFMMESQRAVSYELSLPVIFPAADVLGKTVTDVHAAYCRLVDGGVPREDARLALPEATACRLIIGMNLREFRHILKLRTSSAAWSEMRKLAEAMKRAVADALPEEERFLLEEVTA